MRGSGWEVMGWSRKVDWKCIFLFLVLFKDGGHGVSPRFHLFVSGVFEVFLKHDKLTQSKQIKSP